MLGLRCHAKASAPFSADFFGPHESNDATTAARLADVAQIAQQTATAVEAIAGFVECDQMPAYLRIVLFAFTRRSFLPGIKAGCRYVERAAHRTDFPPADMLVNARVPHRECFANQVAVFLKKVALFRHVSKLPTQPADLLILRSQLAVAAKCFVSFAFELANPTVQHVRLDAECSRDLRRRVRGLQLPAEPPQF